MRIFPDSLVSVVDSTLGSAWVGLNVTHYINQVCDDIASRDPQYHKWLARKLAGGN
jgi:hypothetical protein